MATQANKSYATTTPDNYAAPSFVPPVRETSITAHVVRMACVTMNFSDLERVAYLLDHGPAQTDSETAIVREFIAAVESLR